MQPLAAQYCHRPWSLLRHSRYNPFFFTPGFHFSSSQAIPKYSKYPKQGDLTSGPKTTNSIRRRKIASIKYAYRGGQNLSERYKRLEKSLRGKTAFGAGGNGAVIGGVDEAGRGLGEQIPRPDNGTGSSSWKAKKEDMFMFKGIEIPKEPKPPESDECCMSGCAVCVYDLYDEAMERHGESIKMVKTKLREMGMDENGWPSVLDGESRSGGGDGEERDGGRKKVVIDAFEQLERELASRRAEILIQKTG